MVGKKGNVAQVLEGKCKMGLTSRNLTSIKKFYLFHILQL